MNNKTAEERRAANLALVDVNDTLPKSAQAQNIRKIEVKAA